VQIDVNNNLGRTIILLFAASIVHKRANCR